MRLLLVALGRVLDIRLETIEEDDAPEEDDTSEYADPGGSAPSEVDPGYIEPLSLHHPYGLFAPPYYEEGDRHV